MNESEPRGEKRRLEFEAAHALDRLPDANGEKPESNRKDKRIGRVVMYEFGKEKCSGVCTDTRPQLGNLPGYVEIDDYTQIPLHKVVFLKEENE